MSRSCVYISWEEITPQLSLSCFKWLAMITWLYLVWLPLLWLFLIFKTNRFSLMFSIYDLSGCVAIVETPPCFLRNWVVGVRLLATLDYLYALVLFITHKVIINYIRTGPKWFANWQVILFYPNSKILK